MLRETIQRPGVLPTSSPEAQGIRSAAIGDFLDAVERDIDALHSLIVLRHGHIIAQGWWEPYGPEIPHILYSLSKSFTSTAIGLLVAEGRLSLDVPVLDFFPGDAPAQPSANLQAMRVRHLLSMATGHAEDTTPTLWADPARTWTQAFLAQPVPYAPGTHFLYNTGATYSWPRLCSDWRACACWTTCSPASSSHLASKIPPGRFRRRALMSVAGGCL